MLVCTVSCDRPTYPTSNIEHWIYARYTSSSRLELREKRQVSEHGGSAARCRSSRRLKVFGVIAETALISAHLTPAICGSAQGSCRSNLAYLGECWSRPWIGEGVRHLPLSRNGGLLCVWPCIPGRTDRMNMSASVSF